MVLPPPKPRSVILPPPKPRRRQQSPETSIPTPSRPEDVLGFQRNQQQRSLRPIRTWNPSSAAPTGSRVRNRLERSRTDEPRATQHAIQPRSPQRRVVPVPVPTKTRPLVASSPRREPAPDRMHQKQKKPNDFSPATPMSKRIGSGSAFVRVKTRRADAGSTVKAASPKRTIVPASVSPPRTDLPRLRTKRTPTKVTLKAVSPSPPKKIRSPTKKKISSNDSVVSLLGIFATDEKSRTGRSSVASLTSSRRRLKAKKRKPPPDRPLALRTKPSGQRIQASTFTYSMQYVTASNPDEYRIVHNVRECLRTATTDGAYYERPHQPPATNTTTSPDTEKVTLPAARKERERLECQLAELKRVKQQVEGPTFHKALRRIKTADSRPSQNIECSPAPIATFLQELRKTASSDDESSDEELWRTNWRAKGTK